MARLQSGLWSDGSVSCVNTLCCFRILMSADQVILGTVLGTAMGKSYNLVLQGEKIKRL